MEPTVTKKSKTLPLIAIFLGIGLAAAGFGCPRPVPGTIGQHVVSCGSEAVKKCTLEVIPVVLGCIDSHTDVKACLMGAGSSELGCLTVDAIACATREQRDLVPMQALMANGPTAQQTRRSARAAEFLDRSGVVFDDGR